MANSEHLVHLKQGVKHWNEWRRPPNRNIEPDLRTANFSGADLIDADLAGADLTAANLFEANLSQANLTEARLNQAYLNKAHLNGADLTQAELVDATLCGANLGGANLTGANLTQADLYEANLTGATLTGTTLTRAKLNAAYLTAAKLDGVAHLDGADLDQARLTNTNLSEASLTGAKLTRATLIGTQLERANLSGCNIYGIAAWNVNLKDAIQLNLRITPPDEPAIYVDNLEVAQFVYLLLNNSKIRNVIDTIGKKAVLLLGRFTEGRMVVLERLQGKLRDLGFVPIVFNFDKPDTKDFSETVRLLCNLSHFVIVDITNPRSAPLELQATVPDYMVPFAPILQTGEDAFSMFKDLQNKHDWVLKPVIGYPSVDRLIEVLEDKIVRPAEAKFNQLLARRTQQIRVENV